MIPKLERDDDSKKSHPAKVGDARQLPVTAATASLTLAMA